MDTNQSLGVLNTSVAYLSVQDSIVSIELRPNCNPTLEEIQEIILVRSQLVGSQPFATLIIMNGGTLPPKEIREYIAALDKKNSRATAFLCVNEQESMTANFYLKVNNPASPTRIFGLRSKATNWLMEMLRE